MSICLFFSFQDRADDSFSYSTFKRCRQSAFMLQNCCTFSGGGFQGAEWQDLSLQEYYLRRKQVFGKCLAESLSTKNLPWLREYSMSSSPLRWLMQCCMSWAWQPVKSYCLCFLSSSQKRKVIFWYLGTINLMKGYVRQVSSASSNPCPSTSSGLMQAWQSSGLPKEPLVLVNLVWWVQTRRLRRNMRWKLQTWLAVRQARWQWAAVVFMRGIYLRRSLLRATRVGGTLKVRLSFRDGPKMFVIQSRAGSLVAFLNRFRIDFNFGYYQYKQGHNYYQGMNSYCIKIGQDLSQ